MLCTTSNRSIYLNRLTIKDKEALLKGKTCAIYARVSSKKQVDGESLETQISSGEAYAKKKGLKLSKIYQEDASARTPKQRKQYEKMLETQSSKDKVDVIIFAMVDRLSRNPIDAYNLLQKVEKEGLIVVILKENLILKHPVSADEKLVFDMVLGVSNYQVNHSRDVCIIGTHKRTLSGFRPRKPPYGYRNDVRNHKALVSKKEASFVKSAFELYATGRYTLGDLPEAIYNEGHRYKLQPSKLIPKASLASMLKNLFYTGAYTFKGIDGVIQGDHEPIISKELFNKVQTILNPTSVDRKCYKHTYARCITCRHCGKFMVGDKKVKPSGREYLYYRCTNSKCSNNSNTKQEDIEEAFERYFKEIRLSQIPKELVKTLLKESLEDWTKQKAGLNSQISRKYHEEQKLHEFIEQNDIEDESYFDERFLEIQEKYGDIQTKLNMLEKRIESFTNRVDEVFSKRLYDIYTELSDEAKVNIINLMKNNLSLDKNKKFKMTFKPAFREIRKR